MLLNALKTCIINLNVMCILSVIVLNFSHLIQSNKVSKRHQAAWRIECELGVVSDPECPVDGGWTTWDSWSSCRGSCGDIGHRRRTRQCINPPPSEDGLPCAGPDEEIEPCYITNCTSKDYRKLIEGDPARIEAFHQLEAIPSLMERCLQTECTYDVIQGTLASDNTWQFDSEILWNALQCVKHNLGCFVIGEWGSWGAWSVCGARCGRGLRWRLRRCDTPPPSNYHLMCSGTPLQAEECEGHQCAGATKREGFRGGSWSAWGDWSPCTEKCGPGVRRRRRFCLEKPVPNGEGTWGTHCVGQSDQFEVCENDKCLLDGDWSGWSAWGPCSQTCGVGKRYRTRSCTRPVPTGGGKTCVGSKTEVGSCYLSPCKAYTHLVVSLNGESFLQYNFEKKHSTLFHFYVRFMALSPHGTLVRRGVTHDPHVRLSLQNWHICLDARGTSSSCTIQRICSPSVLDPAVWHSAMITVTSQATTLRLDDAILSIKASFPCDPELPDDPVNILIGERLHAQIQEMVLNFIPLNVIVDRNHKSDFSPTSISNVAYEKAALEEAFLLIHDDQYLRIPCFEGQDDWRLELTVKSKRDSGVLLFMFNDKSQSWLHMGLQNMRLKLMIAAGTFRSEISSSTDCPPGQWLDITLVKKKESNTVEASINAGERMHIVLEEEALKKKRSASNVTQKVALNSSLKNDTCPSPYQETPEGGILKAISLAVCDDEFFIGGIPAELNFTVSEEFPPFSGTISSLYIDNVLQDLHHFSVERHKDDNIQVSSRTASISGSYHEVAWGRSNSLNLTCLHARTPCSHHAARWLYLDSTVKEIVKAKTVRSVDDGRVLKLVASADNDLRGFYTCRAHTNRRTRNIITYGVLGQVQYNLAGTDTTTCLAVITTALLVLATLGWLIIEGIHDLHTGFGFFRDAHFTPTEEAEAVCKYIDAHSDFVGSKSAVKMAKAKARRRGQQLVLASRSSFAAQEPQGLMQIENLSIPETTNDVIDENVEVSDDSEPKDLPPLPNEDTDNKVVYNVYRYEPTFTSTPRHGSVETPKQPRVSSSSSYDLASPRYVCNRLFLKRSRSSRESLFSKKSTGRSHKMKSDLMTIDSSTCAANIPPELRESPCAANISPGQKVLQRFRQLRCDLD